MTILLDANVLIALAVTDHVHHDVVENWFVNAGAFATCPITQGSLVRLIIRDGGSADQAKRVLASVTGRPTHEFWPDDQSYTAISLGGVVGHRQVTDAYLAGLARSRDGRLATLDRGLAALHGDAVDLIDAS